MAGDTLTNVKTSTAGHSFHEMEVQWLDQVMLPAMKQRIGVPRDPLTGQTIVLPARFGSMITASSGTSIHSLSMRTLAALGFPIRF
jgi:hypothetical protein